MNLLASAEENGGTRRIISGGCDTIGILRMSLAMRQRSRKVKAKWTPLCYNAVIFAGFPCETWSYWQKYQPWPKMSGKRWARHCPKMCLLMNEWHLHHLWQSGQNAYRKLLGKEERLDDGKPYHLNRPVIVSTPHFSSRFFLIGRLLLSVEIGIKHGLTWGSSQFFVFVDVDFITISDWWPVCWLCL